VAAAAVPDARAAENVLARKQLNGVAPRMQADAAFDFFGETVVLNARKAVDVRHNGQNGVQRKPRTFVFLGFFSLL
jgi:hypothetical protein